LPCIFFSYQQTLLKKDYQKLIKKGIGYLYQPKILYKECYNMDKLNNSKGTPTKRTANNCSNDQNSEFCNYDIPEVGIPGTSDASKVFPDEVPRRDGPGGE
jgi:hypothetical protein